MISAAGTPLAWRLVRSLSGAGADAAAAAPPVEWSSDGSLAARALAVPVRVLGRYFAPANRALDLVCSVFAPRPLLVVASAALAVPLLRILLPASAALPAGLVLAAAAGAAVLLAAASGLHDGEDLVLVRRALLAGLLLRLLFGAVVEARGGFPDETGYYHPLAADTAACWQAGGPSLLAGHPVVEGRAAYFYLLSGAYWLLGPSMMVGRLLGALLGAAAALAAGEAARPLGGARAAAVAVAVLALHPEHAFWNATLSRDGLATLLVLLALAAWLRRPGRLLRGNLLLVAIPLGLLALNSFLAAGALAAAVILAAGSEALAAPASAAVRAARVAAVSLLGVAALAFVGYRYGNLFTPELFSAVRSRAVGTVPDFFPGLEFRSLGQVALFLPLGWVFVLFAPWPWDAVHLHRALYGGLAAAGLVVTLAGIGGLAAAARRRAAAAAPLLLFGALYLSLLAVLEGTSGIVTRHRLPLTALFCIGAAVLLAGLRRPERR